MSQGTAGFGGGGGGMAGMSSSIQSTGGGLGEMGSYDGLPPSICTLFNLQFRINELVNGRS